MYKIKYSNELSHHGILGMKWGKRNGPPYPLDYSSHSPAEKKENNKAALSNYQNNNLKPGRSTGGYKKSLNDKKSSKKNKKVSNKALLLAGGAAAAATLGIAAYATYKISKRNSDALNKEFDKLVASGERSMERLINYNLNELNSLRTSVTNVNNKDLYKNVNASNKNIYNRLTGKNLNKTWNVKTLALRGNGSIYKTQVANDRSNYINIVENGKTKKVDTNLGRYFDRKNKKK